MWWSDGTRLLPRRAALGLLSASVLAGCGFRIRRPPKLAFNSITLTGFAARSPMAEALQQALQQAPGSSVRVLAAPAQAELVLQALDDSRERIVVASTAAAQVREVQLRLTFNFRVQTPSGRELIPRVELIVKRDLSYRETAALAKEQEEADIFADMQADLVAQVLRRLASVTL